MSQFKFQIDDSGPPITSDTSSRASSRQLTWSATPGPRPSYSPSPQPLSNPRGLPIDPALTSYRPAVPRWTQSSTPPSTLVLPSTETPLPPPPPTKTAAKGHRISSDEETSLVQLCPKNELAYDVSGGNADFWNKIRVQFAKEIGRDYSNPKRKVLGLIQKRKVELGMLKTGDEEKESTYTRAIDNWIEVVETHGNTTAKKKEQAEQVAKKIRKEEKARDNLLRRIGDKRPFESPSSSSSSDNDSDVDRFQTQLPPSRSSSNTPGTPAVATQLAAPPSDPGESIDQGYPPATIPQAYMASPSH